ncbi:MAG: hypothetical protein MAG715_00626 [Methanonatronarchaeales archaeon]|nr:hypothetical protein [Methanonatronarchaeales archaeon]
MAAFSWVGYVYFVDVQKPAIGVIELRGVIWEGKADQVASTVNYTMQNEDIEGVVVVVDSPGGGVSAIERIHGSLLRLKEEKPLVASVEGLAASGGYYSAVSSDYVFAQPSSFIGSIGVISTVPQGAEPAEGILDTGPYKSQGFPISETPKTTEKVLGNFLDAVKDGRGERLNVSEEKLKQGSLHLAPEAERMGLVDETGFSKDAVKRAADLAGVDDYRVVSVNKAVKQQESGDGTPLRNDSSELTEWPHITEEQLREMDPSSYFYYLYVPPDQNPLQDTPPELVPPGEDEAASPMPALEGEAPENVALLDMAHGNNFEPEELQPLINRLVSRGFVVRAYNGGGLGPKLDKVDSFFVANTAEGFTNEEVNAVDAFVKEGGRLLMVNDPTRSGPTEVNGLATNFNVSFSSGYLYDMEDNYGVYRNIYVTEFQGSLSGTGRLMLPTAAHVEVNASSVDAAFTDTETVHSATRSRGEYSPVVRTGDVMAIGDWSFATYPWLNLENNSDLLDETADFLGEPLERTSNRTGPSPVHPSLNDSALDGDQ